jgi:ABC-2 type transport system ATP-binding protein
MITIKDLYKSFSGHKVLLGLDLNVRPGEIYGFIGRNGAGKTTTMNILAGLSGFESGECEIGGVRLTPSKHRTVSACGYLPEEPKFYPYLSAYEYLDMLGNIMGKSSKEKANRAVELLELVGLKNAARRRIGGYSRGMRQRFGLAAAMYHEPKVLLLDEPSSALDPEGRQDMVNILTGLRQEGKTIMLSTHILSDMEHICDRVGVLSGGKMVLEGELDEILKEYASPGIDCVFSSELNDSEISGIRALPFVREAVKEEITLKITVKEPEKHMKALMQALSSVHPDIISVSVRKANLDEVFVKVAK